MNYFCHLNSKTYFRFVREDSQLLAALTPLSLHVNYHPEKPERMKDMHKFYHGGERHSAGTKAGIFRWDQPSP